MEYTVREAATLMGLHPRTVRRMVAAGKIAGAKREGVWMVSSAGLRTSPGAQVQRARSADAVREAVEGALAGSGRTSVLDLGAFRHLHACVLAIADGDPVRALLTDALADLTAGAVAFQPDEKIPLLRRSRAGTARAIATLALREALPPGAPTIALLERQVLPALGGMLRRAERSTR